MQRGVRSLTLARAGINRRSHLQRCPLFGVQLHSIGNKMIWCTAADAIDESTSSVPLVRAPAGSSSPSCDCDWASCCMLLLLPPMLALSLLPPLSGSGFRKGNERSKRRAKAAASEAAYQYVMIAILTMFE